MAPARRTSHRLNQFIMRMQNKLLKPAINHTLTCIPCSDTSNEISSSLSGTEVPVTISLSNRPFNSMVLDENALNELSAKDRRRLVELGRNDELQRAKENVNAVQQLEMTYVSKFLPGDGVNEVIDCQINMLNFASIFQHYYR